MKLSSIIIYPIKSLAGIQLNSAIVEKRGLQYDRRWMLVDQDGLFISQRKFPIMALLQVSIKDEEMIVFHKDYPNQGLSIPLRPSNKESITVHVFNSPSEAIVYESPINDWFSTMLQTDCRLVFMPNSASRMANPKNAGPNELVSFADGYPYLIIGEASLADLNSRMDTPVPMNRFRPNFVFSGNLPYEEDNWSMIKIGNLDFKAVKNCSRCSLITVDQQTGITGKEPLLTLSKYRKFDHKVIFGKNLCWLKEKGLDNPIVRLGDEIIIKE